jgi:glycosidase
MTDMPIYWIKNLDLDGYRCDAAGEIPTDFWEQARTELDRVKPDIMMLAEASKPELMRSALTWITHGRCFQN